MGTLERCQAVRNLIDQFCYNRHWMMHIGDEKAVILERAVVQAKADNLRLHHQYST
jgi:hypothetical protein